MEYIFVSKIFIFQEPTGGKEGHEGKRAHDGQAYGKGFSLTCGITDIFCKRKLGLLSCT